MFAKSSESLDVLHALTSARCLYRSSLEDARLPNKVAVKSGRGESPKTVSDLWLSGVGEAAGRPPTTTSTARATNGGYCVNESHFQWRGIDDSDLCNLFFLFFFTRDSTEVSPCVSYLEEECRPMKNKATNYSAANSNYMCIFVCLCLQWGGKKTHTHTSQTPVLPTNVRFVQIWRHFTRNCFVATNIFMQFHTILIVYSLNP